MPTWLLGLNLYHSCSRDMNEMERSETIKSTQVLHHSINYLEEDFEAFVVIGFLHSERIRKKKGNLDFML